jgi:hypothetical protein
MHAALRHTNSWCLANLASSILTSTCYEAQTPYLKHLWCVAEVRAVINKLCPLAGPPTRCCPADMCSTRITGDQQQLGKPGHLTTVWIAFSYTRACLLLQLCRCTEPAGDSKQRAVVIASQATMHSNTQHFGSSPITSAASVALTCRVLLPPGTQETRLGQG